MKQVVLIDGNNLMFRSYYATAYSGVIMRNSNGFPTNALYGFVSMINKIIHEEKPNYMAVCFDIGKNFRHDKYEEYKAGRVETPEDLKRQMPVAREILDAMGIKHFEVENYEADDIIGTLSLNAENDPDFHATIVSSDKDLLQLLSNQVEMKLLKQTGFIRYNPETFYEDYGIKPIRIIDMKALSGDPSDNIPGVKGIGDKTALKLLSKYDTIEELYEHIDEVTGSVKTKLINGKDSAFFSKEIATIYRKVPLDIDLEECKYEKNDNSKLNEIYKKLEFRSLINKDEQETPKKNVVIKEVNSIDEIRVTSPFAYYIECDNENYHLGKVLGMAVYDGNNAYYIKDELIKPFLEREKESEKYTFDLKKNIILLDDMSIENSNYDLMILIYLLGIMKDDLALITDNIKNYSDLKKENFSSLKENIILKAIYIYDTHDEYIKKLTLEGMDKLFRNIEMPLISVLADMEYTGVVVKKDVLVNMGSGISHRVNDIEKEIYDLAGMEFNISSPKQLGDVLFEHMNLPYGKKGKTGYSTDVKVLNKLVNYHPIITKILEYRNYKKLLSTYIEGLQNYILADGKIHTIYKQNLTRTGRLSSVEPNLQNIPVRDSEGRMIRKAFYPANDMFLCADYSQMELRLLAHISGSEELINAFNNDEDIHTKVASDVYGVSKDEVTKEMRKNAKAVIFGIVYGISGFGLSEGTTLTPKEASNFIDTYYKLYPHVKEYMDKIVKEAYDNGYVTTLFNRKRNIEELQSKVYMVRTSGERIALNTPIQGTCADIMKKAMIEIFNKFKENHIKSKMVLQVHDELIFDIIDSEKEMVESIVKDVMEHVIKLSVPLKVGIDYGDNWYNAK